MPPVALEFTHSSGEEPISGDERETTLQGGLADSSTRGRARNGNVQEVVDELTVETARKRLLDCVEKQLQPGGECVPHVARLMFAFTINDDRKIHSMVDEEFVEWRKKQEDGDLVGGILLYISQAGLHFLEGPTELLFSAIEFFQKLTEDGVRYNGATRAALLNSIRVLYFTEFKGQVCTEKWCSYVHGSKISPGQGVQLTDENCADLVFIVYQKFLLLCIKVQDAAARKAVKDAAGLQAEYRKVSDSMPNADDIAPLLAKNAAECFLSWDEFHEVFIAPFRCVLHSELLWPIPPTLDY